MSRGSLKGRIVTFKDSDGVEKTGVALYKNQTPAVARENKLVINELDVNRNLLIKNGRPVVYIRKGDECNVIGFQD